MVVNERCETPYQFNGSLSIAKASDYPGDSERSTLRTTDHCERVQTGNSGPTENDYTTARTE